MDNLTKEQIEQKKEKLKKLMQDSSFINHK